MSRTNRLNNRRARRQVVNTVGSGYNRDVKVRQIHDWKVSTSEAKAIQEELRGRVLETADGAMPLSVAGADISVKRNGIAVAAVVVLTFPEMELMERRVVKGSLEFPYVPGLLTFREAPLILAAFEQLETTPDLVLVDGQGVAHPRRFGIASHLGLVLDTPTVGCAKSRLCGEHEEPPLEAPGYTHITDGEEIIGAVVRTKTGIKPLYVSIGHRMTLTTAVARVLSCCRGYRLPEPTRLAHLLAGNPASVSAGV